MVVKLLGISVRTLNREIAENRLRAYRFGNARTFRVRLDEALGLLRRVA